MNPYKNTPTNGSLAKKFTKRSFALNLQEKLFYQSKTLHVGCGYGEVSNFLATVNRQIYAVDSSKVKIKEAKEFSKKNNLQNVKFYNLKTDKLPFDKESFDYVLLNSDNLTFEISEKLKKGGYIFWEVSNNMTFDQINETFTQNNITFTNTSFDKDIFEENEITKLKFMFQKLYMQKISKVSDFYAIGKKNA